MKDSARIQSVNPYNQVAGSSPSRKRNPAYDDSSKKDLIDGQESPAFKTQSLDESRIDFDDHNTPNGVRESSVALDQSHNLDYSRVHLGID